MSHYFFLAPEISCECNLRKVKETLNNTRIFLILLGHYIWKENASLLMWTAHPNLILKHGVAEVKINFACEVNW